MVEVKDMDETGITKFRANCCAVIERVRRTRKPILVTRLANPLAEIVPLSIEQKKRRLGALWGTGRITGDIVSPAIDESDLDEAQSLTPP